MVRADRLGSIYPEEDECCPFLHRPVSEELEAVYQKDWKCRKTTYDQEEMNDETDIEIAQECTMDPITEVAERAGIPEEYLEQYGKYKAKIDYNFLKKSDKKTEN